MSSVTPKKERREKKRYALALVSQGGVLRGKEDAGVSLLRKRTERECKKKRKENLGHK